MCRGYFNANSKTFQEREQSGSQAVRLPKEYKFQGKDVLIQKYGDAVILTPHDKQWEVFIDGLNSFSDDYMQDGRDQGEVQERESL